jgi:hypothetical protein
VKLVGSDFLGLAGSGSLNAVAYKLALGGIFLVTAVKPPRSDALQSVQSAGVHEIEIGRDAIKSAGIRRCIPGDKVTLDCHGRA